MTTEREQAIVIPRAVFWGLIVPLITALCLGSAYMANLSTSVATLGSNLVATNARVTGVESRVDINKDASVSKTDSINDRLTRMEAQLGFLVKTSEAKK
jgi:hypothetical protein